jgi:hypothetical protein
MRIIIIMMEHESKMGGRRGCWGVKRIKEHTHTHTHVFHNESYQILFGKVGRRK